MLFIAERQEGCYDSVSRFPAIEQIDLEKSKPNKDFGMSMQEAIDVFYNSETYAKLNNPATGLYFQSSKYVYSYLKNELSTGIFS